MLVPDEIRAIKQSRVMREANADKAGLHGVERELYLSGKSRLKNVVKTSNTIGSNMVKITTISVLHPDPVGLKSYS